MAMIVALQMMLLLILPMAQLQNNTTDLSGWWLRITLERNPIPLSMNPCMLRIQQVVQRDDYTYTPDIGAHKVHKRGATWHEARRICQEEGGHLAIINSIAESRTIAELFKKARMIEGAVNSYWAHIGFHDLFQEGEYVTVHSQSLAKAGFNEWTTGQPDNSSGSQNCGCINTSGTLNDVRCDRKFGFICELSGY